jgi:hypothetical protein
VAVTFIGGGNQSIRKNQTTMRFRQRMQLSKYDKGQKLCLLTTYFDIQNGLLKKYILVTLIF